MVTLEAMVFVLAGLVGIQLLAGRYNQRGAILPAYVIFGLFLGYGTTEATHFFLQEAGQFGFILLLYLLGLEIELPHAKSSCAALLTGARWFLWQWPVLMLVALFMGLPAGAAAFASLAIAGVAVGMAHPLLHEYEARGGLNTKGLLDWLVALEVLAILMLAGGESLLMHGATLQVGLHILLLIGVIVLLAMGAPMIGNAIRWILERSIRWRVHGVLLLLLIVCACSARLGLAAPKAAFFLGLFTHTLTKQESQTQIEKALKPLAHDFLIPIFFVYLGTLVRFEAIFSLAMVWAALTVALIVGWRQLVFRRWFAARGGWAPSAIRTTLPNLTMVAIGVHALHEAKAPVAVVDWLLLSGLLLSVLPMFWKGGGRGEKVPNAPTTELPVHSY